MITNKIRVLHITPSFGVGGAEILLKNLLLSFDKNKFDVAACSLFPKKGTYLERELENSNIKIWYLTKKRGLDLHMVPSLYRLFRYFQPHIAHTHNYVIRYTLIPSLLCKIPLKIHTVHNIAEKEVDFIGQFIHKIAFKFFKIQPVGISKEINRTVEKLYKVKDIPYIYNGVPTMNYYCPDNRLKIRHKLNISDNQFVCINIGRFSQQKNHQLLIEAFSLVALNFPNAFLLLVGDGELRNEIEAFVDYKNITDKVKFLGIRDDIPELLSASDLFVLSSDWEGVPLVVIEAMAAGKPIVATDVGGVSELINNGTNGFLVKKGNSNELAEKILTIGKNMAIAKSMGLSSRMIANEKFKISVVTKQYEQLYLNLMRNNY